ncbi:MAG: P-loop containing nucleoside triphosphate hydrolase protein [Piptocephalis tieghemiana]|nr:MAG: P-loop containing nucleoside triphosphate hydrolase protein [Piptocephalis tieghemiana]
MEALKREEEAEAPGGGNIRKVERPRALLLAPSTELVAQVSLLSKELSRSVKLRTLMLHSGVKRRTLLRSLEQPVDLVIGNPRVFMSMIEEGIMSVSELRWLVLDEADTLLEKDFAQDVESLLGMMHKVSMNRKQPYTAIAVTATLPRAVHQKMEELLPHATCIATPNVHKTGFKMQHNFVDLKEWNNNKERALLDALKGSTDTTTLVFCNRLNTTEILKASLRSRSMDVEALHKNTEPEARKNILDALGIDSVEDLPVRRSSKSKAPSGNGGEEGKGGEEALPQSSERPPPKVIISTDYASRGLDTSRVGHVIMYDFPTTMVDFLHRSGRTGRANRKGRVTCLVGKKDRRLAERIWRAIKGKTVLS